MAENRYSSSQAADFLPRHEGFPNALIEAMACGCPVVSTDCPNGPAEILENGRFGRLVPVGDARAMAAAIKASLDDPPSRDSLRVRARTFSQETAVAAYEALMLNGVGSRPFDIHARTTRE